MSIYQWFNVAYICAMCVLNALKYSAITLARNSIGIIRRRKRESWYYCLRFAHNKFKMTLSLNILFMVPLRHTVSNALGLKHRSISMRVNYVNVQAIQKYTHRQNQIRQNVYTQLICLLLMGYRDTRTSMRWKFWNSLQCFELHRRFLSNTNYKTSFCYLQLHTTMRWWPVTWQLLKQ